MRGEQHRLRQGPCGSIMLEFVLAFPVILTLMLACMQFAHIWMAKQVVHYSAYCAARAALVCEKGEYHGPDKAPQQAAEQVCAWVGRGMLAGESDKRIPGWGAIPGSGGIHRKTRVTIQEEGQWNIKATVENDFALVFPLVGPMIGWGVNPWQSGSEYLEQHVDDTGDIGRADLVQYPHIRFTESVVLPKPYVMLPKSGLPVSGW